MINAQAYLAREQSRFFRPGGGALGRDDEKSQSSDDLEDLDADMGLGVEDACQQGTFW